jgi:hypothetical protein
LDESVEGNLGQAPATRSGNARMLIVYDGVVDPARWVGYEVPQENFLAATAAHAYQQAAQILRRAIRGCHLACASPDEAPTVR